MDKIPECNPEPPNLDQPESVLRYLLSVEMRRLETAERIEKERKLVFPETSIIIRDIMKIQDKLNGDSDNSFSIPKKPQSHSRYDELIKKARGNK